MAANTALTAIKPGTYTLSQSSPVLTNEDGKYLTFVIKVESVTTSTLTVTIKGVARPGSTTDGSAVTWDILASSALNAAGTTAIRIGPGFPATANVSANDMVPLFFMVDAVKGDTSSWKFSVTYYAN